MILYLKAFLRCLSLVFAGSAVLIFVIVTWPISVGVLATVLFGAVFIWAWED